MKNMEHTNDTYVCIGLGSTKKPLGEHFGIFETDLYMYDSYSGFVNRLDGNSDIKYYVRKNYLEKHGVNIYGNTKKTVNLKKDTTPMTFKMGNIYANNDGHLAVVSSYNGNRVFTFFTGPYSGQSKPALVGEFVLVKEIEVNGRI